jgi:two-component sensor histidine kinase
MPPHDAKVDQVGTLLATPDLASALESPAFLRFLDQLPIALVVSTLIGPERIIYANPQFETLSGHALDALVGGGWSVLCSSGIGSEPPGRPLGEAIAEGQDFIGTFAVDRKGVEQTFVDAWSNVIEDDDGVPTYRLAALVDVGRHAPLRREHLESQIREKDMLLQEIQHRVKNNLQMITALLRIEARNAGDRIDSEPFDRLAGRIEAIQALYSALSDRDWTNEIDLGAYLTQIATSVLRILGSEGVRLDLKVDTYPVSVNVAMPVGLVVNELMTNALKHAFVGREGGTILLHSVSDGEGCQVIVADDGVGLPVGEVWPSPGKLSALIVQSLRVNAKADLDVQSHPGMGMRVTVTFNRSAAAPETVIQ